MPGVTRQSTFGVILFFTQKNFTMKKLLIVSNVVFAAIIYLQSCSTIFNPVNSQGISGYYCATDETGGQTFSHFKDVVKRYKSERADIIEAAWSNGAISSAGRPLGQFNDSRAIWFSLDTMKKFICTIEKYSRNLGYSTDQLGIRFYYAVYDDNHMFPRMHTVFMVPTVSNGSGGSQLDFDPRFSFNEKNRRSGERAGANVLNGDFLSLNSNPAYVSVKALIQGSASEASSGSTPTVQNNGELCPSLCPQSNTLTVIDNTP
jgi:hypothetical protein